MAVRRSLFAAAAVLLWTTALPAGDPEATDPVRIETKGQVKLGSGPDQPDVIQRAEVAVPTVVIDPRGTTLRPDRFLVFAAQPDEKQTFLGVSAVPVPDSLRAHLELPAGFGLIVEHIVPDSPAARAGLQMHDVLQKLDDQMLVNIEQLTTLVRAHKPGDKVTLHILRKGKAHAVELELAEQDVQAPVSHVLVSVNSEPLRVTVRPDQMTVPQVKVRAVDLREEIDERLKALEGWRKQLERRTDPVPAEEVRKQLGEVLHKLSQIQQEGVGPTLSYTTAQPARESVSQTAVAKYEDNQYVLTLTTSDGNKRLLVTDTSGQTVFDGPINTAAELEKVPAEVRPKLQKLAEQANIEIAKPVE